jgi:hypothetical protein
LGLGPPLAKKDGELSDDDDNATISSVLQGSGSIPEELQDMVRKIVEQVTDRMVHRAVAPQGEGSASEGGESQVAKRVSLLSLLRNKSDSEKTPKDEKEEKAEKHDQPEKEEKAEKSDKPEKAEKAKASKEDKSSSDDKADKVEVPREVKPHQPKGFLQQANISRFSLCFNDAADGVLRLNTPAASNTHKSVGRKHWALDFHGITVGNASVAMDFCSSSANLSDGQRAPCAAIPDSGTTAIMAPAPQIKMLLEGICDGWDRCRQNYTAMTEAAEAAHKAAVDKYTWDPFDIEAANKVDILKLLLIDCESWMNESTGLGELPALHLKVAGANGSTQMLELPGSSYIMESIHADYEYVYKHLDGIGDVPVGVNHTGRKEKVCSPAFSEMDYQTRENGPVWILGTPLFYEFRVGYDLEADDPAVSFTPAKDAPCGLCGKEGKEKKEAAFVASGNSAAAKIIRPRMTRWPLRRPSINVNEPL